MWLVALPVNAAFADGTLTRIVQRIDWCHASCPRVTFVPIIVVVGPTLSFASSHTHITTDADSASLLSHGPAQNRALCESRKFLCAEDSEWCRNDPVNKIEGAIRVKLPLRYFRIQVCFVLGVLVEVEFEAVLALVTDRKVGEDEVACFCWAVEVCHARSWHSGEDWRLLRRLLSAPVGDRTSESQGSKAEEVCIVREGDVSPVWSLALIDLELDHRRWIDWPSVRRSWRTIST